MAKPFQLKNGTILLSTEAPGGLYNAAQLKKIAAISDANMAIVKATEDQRLALFVKEGDAAKIATDLKSVGLGIRHYQDGLHQPTACIGELCSEHEQDALGAAMDLTKELAGIKIATPLKIGLNGCAACCVPCHTLDVSIVGDAHGYRISLGGKNSQLPEIASFMAEGVPAKELPKLIKKVVTLYQQNVQDGENLQEVMERMGAGVFIAALAPYSQDAAGGGEESLGASDLTEGADDALIPATEDGDLAIDNLEELGGESAEILSDGALLDEGLDDISSGDDNLTMAADLESDVELVMEEEPAIAGDLEPAAAMEDLTELAEETSDLESLPEATEELELLAQDDEGDTLLKDDLTIDEVGDLGELDEDISATDDDGQEILADEIPFTEEDLLMEDTAPLVPTPVQKPAPAVAKAAPQPAPVTEEEAAVEEAGEDFETQLEESIAEEENIRAMSEPDDILQARDEALDILEERMTQPAASAEKASDPSFLKSGMAPKKPASAAPARQDLCGLAMDDQGHLILEFDGGATVALDPNRFVDGTKTLKFGGQMIHITVADEGYHVEADGMTLFQPNGGLAAA